MNKPLCDEQKTITLHNKTHTTLTAKNKRIATFGPHKGKWILYKEYHLAPGESVTTEFFTTDEHQISIYTGTKNGPDKSLYMIRDFDLTDGDHLALSDESYTLLK
ncbi:hypothetical protein JW872_00995 [Candidatus Babeliales bacterium]|nr:hypothetical protein [Candidatus Babeliales bacterium]